MFSNHLIFEPKARPRKTIYKCDSRFHLDEIIDMYKNDNPDTHGIIYTDGNTCTWYRLIDKNLCKIHTKEVILQNQFSSGGQSQNRLMRRRDIQREYNLSVLAEKTVEIFYDKDTNQSKVLNVIICGPAEFKQELADHKLIRQFFQSRLQVIVMGGMMDYDLLIKFIHQIDDPREHEIVQQIRYMIDTADPRLVFGRDIDESLELCEIKTLYVHVDHDFWNKSKPLYSLDIVKVSSRMIIDFGGMIGCKFY
jgi:peptide subunit release factor 1 (eRF1)